MHLDVLAIGAHPDDIELSCGGTVASLAARGRRVGMLHLTRGEASTRGTVETRRKEAEAAAEALGAVSLDFLDCGDGSLRTGPGEEDALIELLRRRRPEIVLGPPPRDRHPDHEKAHQLVHAACFYAGLRRRGQGEPHRPGAVFSYMQHDPFEPSFVVDITAVWVAKMAALDAHDSQLHTGGQARGKSGQSEPSAGGEGEPITLVASEDFRRAVEGRARHYGALIGATFGEPFYSRRPLAVTDPLQLLPGGLR